MGVWLLFRRSSLLRCVSLSASSEGTGPSSWLKRRRVTATATRLVQELRLAGSSPLKAWLLLKPMTWRLEASQAAEVRRDLPAEPIVGQVEEPKVCQVADGCGWREDAGEAVRGQLSATTRRRRRRRPHVTPCQLQKPPLVLRFPGSKRTVAVAERVLVRPVWNRDGVACTRKKQN